VHHMTMAYYMMSYLYHSEDVPLVLGGTDDIVLDGYCDSSWGTGPKGRSICAVLMKLSARSACIVRKATASLTSVRMSSDVVVRVGAEDVYARAEDVPEDREYFWMRWGLSMSGD
jgi:hypothetical protein